MASFFNPALISPSPPCIESVLPRIPEHPLYPRHNLMAGRIRGLVKIYDAGGDVGFEVALERCATAWNWDKVAGPNKN